MSFIESIEPLLLAAGRYAEAVKSLNPQLILPAEKVLHEAAVELAVRWNTEIK
jgi:hypothetical protein